MKSNIKSAISTLMIFVLFAFITCGGPTGETATIRISIGKAVAGKATVGIDQLRHTITFSGPTGTKIVDLGLGGGSVSVAVAPGLWNISVEAFYGDELYAVGTESADVKAGKSTSVLVQMTVVWMDLGDAQPTPFDPGDGTAANPFKVFNVATLQKVGTETTTGGWTLDAHYIVTADINLTGVAFTPIGSFSYTTPGTEFVGTFNGNGKTITGLKIEDSSPTGQGLFGAISGSTAEVKNLTLTGVTIGTTSVNNVGGLVGFNNGGTVENCNVSGSIKGNYNVGGVVGQNDNGGTVENCNASGSINGSYDMGGVVGNNASGTIKDCSFVTGTVDGDNEVGGIVGTNYDDVMGCKFKGTSVTGSNYNIGGVVGKNEGVVDSCEASGTVDGYENVGGVVGLNLSATTIVQNCHATGNVSGNDYTGGVVGLNYGTVGFCYYTTGSINGGFSGYGGTGGIVGQNQLMVENSYSTANVTSDNETGGVVGWNEGTVQNCYSTGSVSGGYEAGGVVGFNQGDVTNCYSTGSITGDIYVGGVVGNNTNTIENCYSTSKVLGTQTTSDNIGGIAGCNDFGGGVEYCVALNTFIKTVGGMTSNIFNVVGIDFPNNIGGLYVRDDIVLQHTANPDGSGGAFKLTYLNEPGVTGRDGQSVNVADYVANSATWWITPSPGGPGFSLPPTSPWIYENGSLPTLNGMPPGTQDPTGTL